MIFSKLAMSHKGNMGNRCKEKTMFYLQFNFLESKNHNFSKLTASFHVHW